MKKSLVTVALASVLMLGLAGCGGNTPKVPISYHKPLKDSTLVKDNNLARVENGAVILDNGNKIYDEDGDVSAVFTIDEKIFYLLKVQDKNLYILKDKNKKIIKTLNATSISWFTDINKVILAVKLAGNRSDIYDNIYDFDGNKLSLINKNISLSRGYKTGFYYVNVLYSKDSYRPFKGYQIVSILDGKKVIIKPKHQKYKSDGYYLLGAVGQKLIYVYNNINRDKTIEIYDMNTKAKEVILDEDSEFQILKSGNQYVLKIFDNKKLDTESQMHGHYKTIKSKYDKESARYLSLNTLKEVKISNDFKPVLVYTGFGNLGGGYTRETYLTLNAYRLFMIFQKDNDVKRVKPIF